MRVRGVAHTDASEKSERWVRLDSLIWYRIVTSPTETETKKSR